MIRSANAALPSVQIGYTIDGLSVDGVVKEAVMRMYSYCSSISGVRLRAFTSSCSASALAKS